MYALFRKLFHWFLNGALVVIPLVLTIAIILYPLNLLSHYISSFTHEFFRLLLNQAELDQYKDENAFFILLRRYFSTEKVVYIEDIGRLPYMNIVFVALLVTFFGFLTSNILIQSGVRLLERIIIKIPGLNILYSYLKEYTEAFLNQFNKPVLVTFNKERNIQKIGFITQEGIQNFHNETLKIAVYVPHSYAFSGELLILPKKDVQLLNISMTEAWKVVFSGGLVEMKKPVYQRKRKN